MQLPTLEPTVVRSRSRRIPKLGIHAATGQARVVIEGRSIYLGRIGPEADERYRQLIAQWLATGRLPDAPPPPAPRTLSVGDLTARFLDAHVGYYRSSDGTPTRELVNFADAFKPLLARYGNLPADQFSPRRLKDVQAAMVVMKWCRPTINHQFRRVRRVFKWATGEELVPAGVCHGLQAVDGLKLNRTDAPEPDPIEPVPEADYLATLEHLGAMVRAMVELQYLTGMWVSEVRLMRTGEIDRRGPVWRYLPRAHKTAYCGNVRVVPISPKAQAILKPWLKLVPDALLSSPEEDERRRYRAMRRARKTKVQPSQLERATERAATADERARPAGEVFTVDAYRRAVARACKRAGVDAWAPTRLRHDAAVRIRQRFGIEVARCYLGHADIRATQFYSSMDEAKALNAAARVG